MTTLCQELYIAVIERFRYNFDFFFLIHKHNEMYFFSPKKRGIYCTFN